MRKILFFLSSLILFTLLLAGCIDQKCEHLYIISTNDIHSSIDAFPRLATLVAEYETKGEVLLVDAGDRVSGNAYVDDATEPGIPIIDLMNTIGYDAATLGNHEFDFGYAQLMENLKWKTRLWAYTTYKRAEIEWENTITFQFNRYISSNIFLYPRFDDGAQRKDDQSYWQFKEFMSIGFSYSF